MCIKSNRYEKSLFFKEEGNMKYNNSFYYNLSFYVNRNEKIEITCKKHKYNFKLSPSQHLSKRCGGCNKCILEYKKNKLINDFNKIHNSLYDYSLILKMKGLNIKNGRVDIICEKHGKFNKSIQSHMVGNGCQDCSGYHFYTSESFIDKCLEVHNNLYSYPNLEYNGYDKTIKVECSKHGEFKPTANNHISGSGCPICRLSKGELKIMNWLINNDIKYEKEKRFIGCEYKYKLPFDFYLPNYNMCIEYDGRQHFESEKYYGGMESFDIRVEKDKIRNKYCSDNNIKLLRISYWNFKNIEDILHRELN